MTPLYSSTVFAVMVFLTLIGECSANAKYFVGEAEDEWLLILVIVIVVLSVVVIFILVMLLCSHYGLRSTDRRSDDKLYHHDKFDGSVSNGQSYSQWREKKRSVVTRSNRSQTQAVQYQNPGAMDESHRSKTSFIKSRDSPFSFSNEGYKTRACSYKTKDVDLSEGYGSTSPSLEQRHLSTADTEEDTQKELERSNSLNAQRKRTRTPSFEVKEGTGTTTADVYAVSHNGRRFSLPNEQTKGETEREISESMDQFSNDLNSRKRTASFKRLSFGGNGAELMPQEWSEYQLQRRRSSNFSQCAYDYYGGLPSGKIRKKPDEEEDDVCF